MNQTNVQNMKGASGGVVPNQFEIFTEKGKYFQSYSTIIAFKPFSGKVQLDRGKWDYSQTTRKYRNLFLRETSQEIKNKIKGGEYILTDLN